VTSPATAVKFMTEGILLRELHSDHELRRYEIVVVDEAHERGVNQDLILALLKSVLRRRPDLKVVVMSATIDEERFAKHFASEQGEAAPIIKVPGRVFPVEVHYAEETPYNIKGLVNAAVDKVCEIAAGWANGDILVFMPDEQTIRMTCDLLEGRLAGVRLLPLYGSQSPDEQREVFRRTDARRVIVATNIAETSITIDGIVHVVDTGLIKGMQYVSAAMSALRVMEHSQAGCNQRAGRAGRTQPGICHRLYGEDDFKARVAYTEPEILRMSLDQVLLHLRTLGYSMDEVVKLELMDAPGEIRWEEAATRLETLGALSENGEVTTEGRRMERLPVAPMLARILLTADKYGCLEPVARIAAGLTGRSVFVRPRGKEDEAEKAHQRFVDLTSDALTLLRAYRAWQKAGENGIRNEWARDNFLSSRALREIDENSAQILAILEQEGMTVSASDDNALIRKAVAAGLIVNFCVKSGRWNYRWQKLDGVYIHPSSALHVSSPRMMVCAAIVETTKVFARDCTAIEKAWLSELLPEASLERKYSLDGLFGEWRLLETITFQGMEIETRTLEAWPKATRPVLVQQLLREMMETSDGLFRKTLLHPQSATNQKVWQALADGMTMSRYVSVWLAGSEKDQHVLELITAWLLIKIKGASSLEALRAMDIGLRLEDIAPASHLAACQAALEKIDAKKTQRQQVAGEAERRLQEERARLTKRVVDLDSELASDGSLRAASWRSQLRELELSFKPGSGDIAYARSRLARLELEIDKERDKRREQLALSEKIWTVALEYFPRCPLCDSEWSKNEAGLYCQSPHNHGRLIWLDDSNRQVGMVGKFLTNNGDQVGYLQAEDDHVMLVVSAIKNQPWKGAKFKSVRFEAQAVILPPEFAGKRQQILDDLAMLQTAQKELAVVKQSIAALGSGNGHVKRLTFKTLDGRAVAREGTTRYEAAYGENYPSDGETWFCRVGKQFEMGGQRFTEVAPEVKVGTVSTDQDLQDLQAILRETYPGLPDELLQLAESAV
ncbi:MAG: oligonucleotide/oligosaccharide-binding fold domain-containing protein, partial [Patescibacteria group bacterium]